MSARNSRAGLLLRFGRLAGAMLLISVFAFLLANVFTLAWWRASRTSVVHAQERIANTRRPYELSYVPRDALLVFATRPAELMNRPALGAVGDSLAELGDGGPLESLEPADFTEVRVVLLLNRDRPALSSAVTVRTSSREAAARFADFLLATEETVQYGDTSYFRTRSATVFFKPDELTFVMAEDEPTLRRCIAAGPSGATSTNWAERWAAAADRDGLAAVNTSLLRGMPHAALAAMLGDGRTGPGTFPEMIVRVAPLWQKSEWLIGEFTAGEEIILRGLSQSVSEEEAQQVRDAILTAISLGRLSLAMARSSAAEDPGPRGIALLTDLDAIDALLEKTQVVRQETRVGIVSRIDATLTQRLGSMLVPAALAARVAGHRAQSSNNLKMLALAIHNYHDVHKALPAAKQIGPKDTPRSWRVTILPYMGESRLYQEYRQDEPWDSEHNRKILARMPEPFRAPGDRPTSTNASYFALVGPGTVFEETSPRARSLRFADIVDGTSNTILLVESKQPTPWTKPEDIPFDPEQPLPEIGGWYADGFPVTFCDGSTRFAPADIDPETLRRAILRSDGQPVDWPR